MRGRFNRNHPHQPGFELVEGIAPEYVAMCQRVMGAEGSTTWLTQLADICPRMNPIFIKPSWVGLFDFETRLPSVIERPMVGG